GGNHDRGAIGCSVRKSSVCKLSEDVIRCGTVVDLCWKFCGGQYNQERQKSSKCSHTHRSTFVDRRYERCSQLITLGITFTCLSKCAQPFAGRSAILNGHG